jgi:hypothetical protein
MKKLIEKIHFWAINLVVGKTPVIMNCGINCEGIKDDWYFYAHSSNKTTKSVIYDL